MNGLDREAFSVSFVLGGEVWRNEGSDGPDGWFYWVGSAATQGPFPNKETAITHARRHYGEQAEPAYRYDFDRLSGTGIIVRLADNLTSLRYTGEDALRVREMTADELADEADDLEFS